MEVGLRRASARSAPDRFEQEKKAFFERVRTAYLQRAANDPQRFAIIDASQTLDLVQQQIAESVTRFLEQPV